MLASLSCKKEDVELSKCYQCRHKETIYSKTDINALGNAIWKVDYFIERDSVFCGTLKELENYYNKNRTTLYSTNHQHKTVNTCNCE